MNFLYLLTFVLLSSPAICAPTTESASNPEKIAEILTLAKNFRILNTIPTLGISIVHHNNVTGDLVIAEGIGLRDWELQLEANNKTLFPIGSNSKAFSAAMIVKILHEKFPELGESVLDTPIKKLVPTFDFVLSDRFRTEFVTFRDIFAMRVCILSSGGLEELFGSPSKEDFFYRVRYYNETCSLRNGFEYSNALYGLAGEIAAFMSNSTVEQIVIDFMKDLGMNDSTFFDIEGRYETLPNIAKAYYKRFGVIYQFDNKMLKRVSAVLTAGAIMVTPEDMVKYMNFRLNKGKVGHRQVVPEEVMSWLVKASNKDAYMTIPLGRKSDDESVDGVYGYGFGSMLSLYDGYSRIVHGGFYPPYNSQFSFFPDLNIGLFTSSNGPGVTGLETGFTHEGLHNLIYKVLRNDDITTELDNIAAKSSATIANIKNDIHLQWISQTKSQSNSAVQKPTQSPRKLDADDIVGLFGNADTGDIIIHKSKDGEPLIDFGEYATNGTMERIGDSNSSFTIQWTTSIIQNFYIYRDSYIVKFLAHFPNENELVFELGSNVEESLFVKFRRNATVDTFPRIPWAEGDCGPKQ